MTLRAVVRCDGEFPGGVPCRQATPVGDVRNGAHAREVAHNMHGWIHKIEGEDVRDLCHQCGEREARQ